MKKVVAVIFGGESSEYEVSLKSASSVIENLDKNKYKIITIGITREGKWLRYFGDIEGIKNDTWYMDNNCINVMFSLNKGDKQLIEIKDNIIKYINVDIVFPVLHGRNGEDGSLQGLLEITGIPYVGCGVLSSAICLDKDLSHKIVECAGFNVPKSIAISSNTKRERIFNFAEKVKYPIFVKPANEGSSIGMTKANNEAELFLGIKEALKYDRKVVLEGNIEGYEVGCAIIGEDELIVGTVDEIELLCDFFDFKEKYTLKKTRIHLPARIDKSMEEKIKEVGKGIYMALGCKGLSRVDMFVDKNNKIIFNEVNTMPGFTTGSRFPKMLLHSGMEYKDILDKLIEMELDI
jgi:D-alanine---D-serine ligase